MGVAFLAGCQDGDITEQGSTVGEQAKYVYNLTAKVSKAEVKATTGTRSLVLDGTTLRSVWEEGDKLMVYNLSEKDASNLTGYSMTLPVTPNTNWSDFKGNVNSSKTITTADELCFLYPGAAFNGDKTMEPVQWDKHEFTDDKGKKYTIEDYFPHETIKNTVSVDLRKQDGTLQTIGKRFDIQYAKKKPKEVNGKDIKVLLGKVERKVAIWGLNFKDDKGQYIQNIKEVQLVNVGSFDYLKLDDGTFVNAADDTHGTITLKPATKGATFENAEGKYVWAALLPGTFKEFEVRVITTQNVLYSFSFSGKQVGIQADNVYRSTVGNMKIDTPPAYIEVQGVKWAPGNFIHYKNTEYSNEDYPAGEYWGIAPTQWWIADYATPMYYNNIRFIGSQSMVHNAYKMNPNDKDLWRYGDIADALVTLSGNNKYGLTLPRSGSTIRKKYFKFQNDDPQVSTATREFANYGDIVWYYTELKKQKYRMPSEAEVKKLFSIANIYAAYCYTDKGNRIYGAYLTTNTSGLAIQRINNFGGYALARDLTRYVDKTKEVRNHQGLFLPFCGFRQDGTYETIGYRCMGYMDGYFSKYWTDQKTTADLSTVFHIGVGDKLLGTGSLGFGGESSKASFPIRPVYDETNTNTTDRDPIYPGFVGLR